MNVKLRHFYGNTGPAQVEIKGKALTETVGAGCIRVHVTDCHTDSSAHIWHFPL